MADHRDFEKRDGTIDWKALRRAEVAEGSHCCKCGTYILSLFGPSGGPRQCGACKALSDDAGTVDHEHYVRCPKCGHTWDPTFDDDYSLYEDGEHDLDCERCDHSFEVSTSVSYSFESPERLPEDLRIRERP